MRTDLSKIAAGGDLAVEEAKKVFFQGFLTHMIPAFLFNGK